MEKFYSFIILGFTKILANKFPKLFFRVLVLLLLNLNFGQAFGQLYWRIDGTTATLTSASWSTTGVAPFTSPWVNGSNIIFNATSVITNVTNTPVGNISINNNSIVTLTTAGTFSLGGGIRIIDIAGTGSLIWNGQNISTAAGSGIIKNGTGTWDIGSQGNLYPQGITVNAGVIIPGSSNAFGNLLIINGGTIQSSGLTFPQTITVGGNFNLTGTGNATFSGTVSLGAASRTITNSLTSGSRIFSGVISGAAGIAFDGAGSGIFDITNTANTFTGPINLNGGQIHFATDASFGNSTNPIIIDGGQLRTDVTFSVLHSMQLGTLASSGINVNANTLTIGSVITDKTISGILTKYGAGTLVLTGLNTYTGTTTIAASGGTLQLNRAGGTTIPVTNNIKVNSGTLQISTDQTINDLSLINGNLTIDNGVTLIINGTLDYFAPATITLLGSGKIAYGPTGTLKYSGSIAKIPTSAEFPTTSGPYAVNINNSGGVSLPFNRTITGSLILNAGTFTIGAFTLDLDGASLTSTGGFLAGNAINSSTSNLTVRGTTGGTVTIPTTGNIGLQNVTMSGTRTLVLNGITNNDLYLSGTLSIANGASFDNGGQSQIIDKGGSINISGTFITKHTGGFTGTGTSIPGINPILNSKCTIEYGLATGSAQVVTSRTNYQNITFSGSGIKTLAGPFNPAGTVYITGTAVVDALNHTFGNTNTKLTMDGGRLRVSGTSTKPDMEDVYTLTGGVIEFYNSTATNETINGEYGLVGSGTPIQYYQIEVTGNKVANSNTNITLGAAGLFTVKNGGVFEINDDGIIGTTGFQSVVVEGGGVFKTGDKDGFSGGIGGTATSVNLNIDNITLQAGSTVEYSRDDIQNITNSFYSNLTISGIAGIKTAPSPILTVDGDLLKTGASMFAHNNGNIAFVGSFSNQSFSNTGSTAFTFYDLTNSNTYGTGTGLSIASSLNVENSFTFSANSKLNLTAGDITLLSTAVNTARVATVPTTASISYPGAGRFIVERYYNGRRGWRLATAPLAETPTILNSWQNGGTYTVGKGMLVSGPSPVPAINGLDDSPLDNPSLKTFNIITGLLEPILNTRDISVPSAYLSRNTGIAPFNIGYFVFVRGDRNPINTDVNNYNNTTLSVKGKLQTGTMTFDVSNPLLPNGYALVGNPYASPINFATLIKNNVDDQFIVHDPYLGASQGAYVYVSADIFNPGSYNIAPVRPGGQTDQFIQSGQAFYVPRTSGTASLVISESDKSTAYNPGLMRPLSGGVASSFRTNLSHLNIDSTIVLVDGNLVDFRDQHNNGIDKYDAIKFSNIKETFGLKRDGYNIAIERRKTIATDDTLFYHLTKTSPGAYRLQFIPIALDPLLTAFLEDNYTHIQTPVSIVAASSCDFVINGDIASADADRFKMIFKYNAAGPLPLTFSDIKAYELGAGISVEWRVEHEINIARYEIEKSSDGITFDKVHSTLALSNGQASTYTWLDTNPFYGDNFYRVSSVDLAGKTESSRIVKVTTGMRGQLVNVYPNPVTGNNISVQFNYMPAGKYNLRLLNSLGQILFNRSILYTGGSLKQSVLTKKLPGGTYQLEVSKPGMVSKLVKVLVNN